MTNDDWRDIVAELEAELEDYRLTLAIFADDQSWRLGGICDPYSGNFEGQSLAQEILQRHKGR